MDDLRELVEFLQARIEEDRLTAEAAVFVDEHWRVSDLGGDSNNAGRSVVDGGSGVVLNAVQDSGAAVHAARWDPDRVLRQCDAAEAVVGTYMRTWNEMQSHPAAGVGVLEVPDLAATASGDPTFERTLGRLDALVVAMRGLAASYADHADYDETWRRS